MLRLAIHRATDVLRADPWAVREGHTASRLMQLALMLASCGLAYGAVMGSFGGFGGDRLLAVAYAAIKVPLLLAGTFVICLPSFFVVNTFMGLRADFAYAVRALVAAQAGLTLILASFAPFTVVWYVSFASYPAAIMFNFVMFGLATILAQTLLRRLYQPLIQQNPRHRWVLLAWLITYAFVGVEMGWLLRPFVGNPDTAVTFIRQQAWGNAYEALARTLMATLR